MPGILAAGSSSLQDGQHTWPRTHALAARQYADRGGYILYYYTVHLEEHILTIGCCQQASHASPYEQTALVKV